jgi:hypothetical protein
MANFTLDLASLERGLNTYQRRLDLGVAAVLELFAAEVEQRAKQEHAWQNRTGAAEAGLNAGVEVDAATHITTLYLQHGDIDYGWWLETRWGGRFGIIQPVLESTYAPVMAALRGALG